MDKAIKKAVLMACGLWATSACMEGSQNFDIAVGDRVKLVDSGEVSICFLGSDSTRCEQTHLTYDNRQKLSSLTYSDEDYRIKAQKLGNNLYLLHMSSSDARHDGTLTFARFDGDMVRMNSVKCNPVVAEPINSANGDGTRRCRFDNANEALRYREEMLGRFGNNAYGEKYIIRF